MNHTDNHFFLNLYQSNFSNNSKSTTILKRQDVFHSINGDAFYPLNSWPSNIKRIFWQKPITDKDTFKLFLFFIGNGGSPNIIAEWVFTSQYWGNERKAEKRARQMDFLLSNRERKADIWFYFDILHQDWRFLNGRKRYSANN